MPRPTKRSLAGKKNLAAAAVEEMPTQKVCSFCKENIGVATKTCKHCGTKQPAKERLEKQKEKFTAEWKEHQKKNCSINKVYDATNLLLHKWNLLESHPVLFLSKKTKNGIVAEFLCPWDIEAEAEETSEDPDGFLRQRPLSCPVVLVSEDNCMIAIGNMPVTTFNAERFNEGLLYLMAYYYALHLTYPKCISTLLSVLQTEILQDSIHEQDLTPSYKKAIGEWKSFIE
ncbi:hypothetical protein D5F01_LYC24085 [Larimichthys crocea]|uniref:Uncharacterized protein n=1 Tax=Larimichthys crocea TaxID=215358 RepID=A0A6G0HF99_LARCR|nr:hypothetical protein D5F01_LYC24085 [Larimichthys crocea]